MEYRKLISFGKGSFVISIPKPWIEKNKLKKGDLLGMEETHSGLMLTSNASPSKKEEKKITITVDGKGLDRLKAEIVSAYLNNYDLFEIITKDLKNDVMAIKNTLMDLAGLEIMEQTSTRLVAKYLIDINEVSVNSLIRRMDIITRSMIEDTMKCMDNECDYETVHQRDSDVNRLHFLAYRVIRDALTNPRIREAMGKDNWALQSDKSVVMRIEKIADRQKRVARYLQNTRLDKQQLKKLKELYTTIQQVYQDVMKAYYTNDIELAYSIELSHKKRLEDYDHFLEEHTHCELAIKGTKKQKCDYRIACAATALIMENLKAMATSIKYIARTIMGGE